MTATTTSRPRQGSTIPADLLAGWLTRRVADNPGILSDSTSGAKLFQERFGVTHRTYLRMKKSGRVYITTLERVADATGRHPTEIDHRYYEFTSRS